MSYQALARKWRPTCFGDVVGQDHVVRALTAALDQDRVHHAFLFTGTRGVGKTTLARLLAKSLNCELGVSSQPCGNCASCQGVDKGRFIDLIEVDAASRTRVDDTREILDNVQYTPTQGRCKVYLIDEVHMLSAHSFNALLKTLEEPPGHVKFLLATTDPQKLPATILSRCLQFNLRALDSAQIAGQLEKILIAESIEYDEGGLATLARVAAGSMRDGLSLLDQSIAFGDGSVTDGEVREMLGMIEDRHVEAILQALAVSDATQIVQIVGQMRARALDYLAALDDLLCALHDISLYHVSPVALEAKGGDIQSVAGLADQITAEDAQLFYQIGLYGKRDLPIAPDPASGFEMALLRMLAFRPMGDESQESGITKTQSRSGESVGPVKGVASKCLSRKNIEETATISAGATAVLPPVHADHVVSGRPNLADPEIWASLVIDSSLEGIVRELAMNLAPVEYAKGILTVAINSAAKHLYNSDRLTSAEEILSEEVGTRIKLRVIDVANEGAERETPASNRTRRAEEAKAAAYQTLMQDPTVQEVIKRFDATVVPDSVRPGNQRG